jgi:hypothetical protein
VKKTFSLNQPGKHPDRLIEAIKNELRKYLRRENRRELPEEMAYWDFDCRFGPTEAGAEKIPPADVIKSVDKAKTAGWEQFYMEILVRAVPPSPKK